MLSHVAPEAGSSPLARGTHRPRHAGCAQIRFIPAGAGNTRAGRGKPLPVPVHPRWRGEHLLVAGLGPTPSGSSPLARGTRCAGADWPANRRFIPAGAGNTRCRGVAVGADRGSSPLARGTPGDLYLILAQFRFIPAGAGNTNSRYVPSASVPVHPRWRGEHCAALAGVSRSFGSSPLARGTQGLAVLPGWNLRFIPAGAGNTRPFYLSVMHITVHPRWRGEHATKDSWKTTADGSSPLARGTHHSGPIPR